MFSFPDKISLAVNEKVEEFMYMRVGQSLGYRKLP